MMRRRRGREPGDDGAPGLDSTRRESYRVTHILARLDSVVDRLEGVYDQLVPLIEDATGSRPVELHPDRIAETPDEEAGDAGGT